MERLIDGARSVPGEGDDDTLTNPWWVGKLREAVGSSKTYSVIAAVSKGTVMRYAPPNPASVMHPSDICESFPAQPEPPQLSPESVLDNVMNAAAEVPLSNPRSACRKRINCCVGC